MRPGGASRARRGGSPGRQKTHTGLRHLPWTSARCCRQTSSSSGGSSRIPGVDATISGSKRRRCWLAGCLSALARPLFDFAGSRANRTYTQLIRAPERTRQLAHTHTHTAERGRSFRRCGGGEEEERGAGGRRPPRTARAF